jgi:L-cysteine:1D-myo-inositol 2-amino-2-deoxy-alpha-D-glucopyranoside ligase
MGASEAQVATGQWPYARHYTHAGMVRLDGEKMSKSRGNLVFVSRLRAAGVDPAAIRLAILAHHYREDWDWTDEGLTAALERLAAWRAAIAAPGAPSADAVLAGVRRHLADDLDAPGALAVVDRWAEDTRLRGGAPGAEDASAGAAVRDIALALLGVRL